MNPKGKVALVTGGSRGIGAATCLALAEAGADVAINYLAHSAAAEQVMQTCWQYGVRAVALQADVSRIDDISRLIEETVQDMGGLDILVNNAGIMEPGTLESTTESQWNRVIDTCLKSIFFCTQAALPYLKKSGEGRVVNLGSLAGKRGTAPPSYAAAKAGIMGLTMSQALELAPYGITVNTVCPGLIATEFGAGREHTLELGATPGAVPLGRAGTSEEVAEAILGLIRADYISGEHIHVNGGRFMSL